MPGQRHVVAQQAAADFQRGEVAGDDDHAAAARRARRQGVRGLRSRTSRRNGATEPHHARENSNTPMPSAAKCSRSNASRARVVEFAGKHSARLRAATSRRARSAIRSNAAQAAAERALQRPRQPRPARPARRCRSHDGQVRGARGAGGAAKVGACGHARDSTRPRRPRMRGCAAGRRPAGFVILSRCRHDPPNAPSNVSCAACIRLALYAAGAGHGLPPDLARFPPDASISSAGTNATRSTTTRRTRARCGSTRSRSARSTPRRRWSMRCARCGPDLRLLVTTITPDRLGARARAVGRRRVEHVYLPYDLPGAVSRFLAHFRPRLALVMETELWPNLLFGCRDRRHPGLHRQRAAVGTLAARLPRAQAAGRRARCARCAGCWRNRRPMRERFVRLGAAPARTLVTGNLKYDIADRRRLAAIRRRASATHAGARPVWIAASTHVEEEAAVVAIHRACARAGRTRCCCGRRAIPERFKAVAQQCVACRLARGDATADAMARCATTACS